MKTGGQIRRKVNINKSNAYFMNANDGKQERTRDKQNGKKIILKHAY